MPRPPSPPATEKRRSPSIIVESPDEEAEAVAAETGTVPEMQAPPTYGVAPPPPDEAHSMRRGSLKRVVAATGTLSETTVAPPTYGVAPPLSEGQSMRRGSLKRVAAATGTLSETTVAPPFPVAAPPPPAYQDAVPVDISSQNVAKYGDLELFLSGQRM
ncbi:PREDICTED: uncharacterized protein LOC106818233 [Priapulus caudatus]|uniref:Uncharacterized protein LOC106818233 n=1 Tax=Priapulus caudatus TaxID=37621 RepID=A0ABM1F1X3_PRICU|nr:PREDICTED: uncharacterized protein LOC106818233 [Priapulus caudatus]